MTEFLLISSNCQGKNNFFFSTSSEQYREIGLIYVPLTERKRDKRHHETIKRKLVRCAEGDGTPVHRESTVCNFTLFYGCSGIASFQISYLMIQPPLQIPRGNTVHSICRPNQAFDRSSLPCQDCRQKHRYGLFSN